MTTTLASQLQAIRSASLIIPESQKHPITRPSILFSPKEAADIDIDTIFAIALSGLEVLVGEDIKFKNFKNDLFNHKTKELNRELLPEADNKSINSSISSFLRLLSGFLALPASLKTLEYLIRRYKVHVYNSEDLILCALPYHDTHFFVQIVQLLNFRNDKWKFLEGVKLSGAPLRRHVIVQQCVRDFGVLEALCNYATPAKKYRPSRPVLSLCTAVIVESLGSLTTVESDTVNKLLPFVSSGLKPCESVSPDHKASALIIIGLLSCKVSLSPKLVKSLIRSVSETLCEDAKDSTNLQWLRLSLMPLINLIQLQHVDLLPKKSLNLLMETRDIIGVLLELSREYNINKFLSVLCDSLADYSFSDETVFAYLVSVVETIPIDDLVGRLTTNILSKCWKAANKDDVCKTFSGKRFKNILLVINAKYPSEFHQSLQNFMEGNKDEFTDDETQYENVCKFLDGHEDSYSKTWLALHHLKAGVRCDALKGLKSLNITESENSKSMITSNIESMILQQVLDTDLKVVQATLSIDGFIDLVNISEFISASSVVVERCISVLSWGSAENAKLASDVAFSLFKIALPKVVGNDDLIEQISVAMFPGLLIFPKTQKLNFKILALTKNINWYLYQRLEVFPPKEKKLQQDKISELNMENVNVLREAIMSNHADYLPWLMKASAVGETSKCLFLLVLMQSFTKAQTERDCFEAVYDATISNLKKEWVVLASSVSSAVQVDKNLLQWDERNFMEQLSHSDLLDINLSILACIFWRILEGLFSLHSMEDDYYNKKDCSRFWELFHFFATAEKKHLFKEHLLSIAKHCCTFQVDFLLSNFTKEDVPADVQVESLYCFALICSDADDALQLQLLSVLPSLLVPLLNNNQDVKTAAIGCIEEFFIMSRRGHNLSKKNGNNPCWFVFLDDLLAILVEQKRQILSDSSFLSSFFTALLGSSCDDLRVPANVSLRFEQSTKDKIVGFIVSYALSLCDSAKLAILSLVKGLGSRLLLVKDVELMMCQLLERRNNYDQANKLSDTEVKLLCLLLEICSMPSPFNEGAAFEDLVLGALQLNDIHTDDYFAFEPCLTSLMNLKQQFFNHLSFEKQELFFQEIISLNCNRKADIQNAARIALLKVNIPHTVMVRTLEHICKLKNSKNPSDRRKKTNVGDTSLNFGHNFRKTNVASLLNSFLDVLNSKKDMPDREFLILPLFNLLKDFFPVQHDEQSASEISETTPTTFNDSKQAVFSVLKDIIMAAKTLDEEIRNKLDVQLLVKYAHSEKVVFVRNHIISLLTTIAKVNPDNILNNLADIVSVLGESLVPQVDSFSQHVVEEFVSVIVPCWLAKTGDSDKLLEIFVKVLPQISDCRRLSIMIFVLRKLGEQNCLASLLLLLFRSVAIRYESFDQLKSSSEALFGADEWEYCFALHICQQYTHTTWLPALVSLVHRLDGAAYGKEMLTLSIFVTEFISVQLTDPQLVLELESSDESKDIHDKFRILMEYAITISSILKSNNKQKKVPGDIHTKAKNSTSNVLKTIIVRISPSAYFRGISNLLGSSDDSVTKRALEFVPETIKNHSSAITKSKANLVDDKARKHYKKMCLEIVRLINKDEPLLQSSAIGTTESLVRSFPDEHDVYITCLPSISKAINSPSSKLASAALRATGALINALGHKSLTEVPKIMQSISEKLSETSKSPSNEALVLSLLVTIESMIDKFGEFLSPHLSTIFEFLILHPELSSEANSPLQLKASTVRNLLTDKISMRLALPPLANIFPNAVSNGASSVSLCFEMLESFVSKMDRASVAAHHLKAFEICLRGLDLRRQQTAAVEKTVVKATVSLTMKLTETMFKPLFVKSIEWTEEASLHRMISFFSLVNGLAENHRSLFVPYFKHIVEICVRHLNSGPVPAAVPRKKKAKITSTESNEQSVLSWHLRALIISSLHKCFLYDTGAVKFLESTNFNQLMKPLVAQLTVDPPPLEDSSVPSVNEVDEMLVLCVGQMGLASGSDLFWKPLNHEVLMQTRSEKMRARVLGLRIVKFLLEHLKEEFLVLLPETMPFLAELLEDVELPVKSLTQDILKLMEALSGESLSQYLL